MAGKVQNGLSSTERSRQSRPQYGKGNFAVNSRTQWRTLAVKCQIRFFLCDFRFGGCYKLNMTPDSELLRRYARTNSEDAFAELVRRHVNLVYSAALRQVNGDAHLAQDVAQTVFTDLARKAGSLARRETLTGWLYTSAHFAAAKIARTENRRRDREEKFMREPTKIRAEEAASPERADWEKLRPVLDDAMHELKETDREAILLRYFENRQFAEVGAKLGLNENAARMRVERALEKLRAIFAKRGITTATALASVISANAVQLAPANLAATLTTASIAGCGNRNLHTFENYDCDPIKTRHQRAGRGRRDDGVGGSTSNPNQTARGKRIVDATNRATENRQRKSFKPSSRRLPIPKSLVGRAIQRIAAASRRSENASPANKVSLENCEKKISGFTQKSRPRKVNQLN